MPTAKAYDDLIMDHIRNARGYRAADEATHTATGTNPLCGDVVTIALRIVDDEVEDVSYQCECCGICMASASILVQNIGRRSMREARSHAQRVIDSLKAPADSTLESPEEMALARTAQEFPARVRCASTTAYNCAESPVSRPALTK
mgnify:CR=1 FL=1